MKQDVYDQGTAATANRPRGTTTTGSGKPNLSKEEIMQKVQEAGRPGPSHKALEDFVGNWSAEVKCWMDPAAEPNVSKGSAKVQWAFDGRFLEEEFRGDMMGQPFTGRLLLGYDNTKQKFVSSWVDSLHTSISRSEGRGEGGNKVITLEGKMDCPATGQRDIPVKDVIKVQSHDRHTFEMYNNGQKTMEIVYTRQQ